MHASPETFPPVIDLAQWTRGGSAGRGQCARQMDRALSHVGFCQVVNHGLRDGLIQEAFAMMQKLFALPLEEKMRIAKENSPFFRCTIHSHILSPII